MVHLVLNGVSYLQPEEARESNSLMLEVSDSKTHTLNEFCKQSPQKLAARRMGILDQAASLPVPSRREAISKLAHSQKILVKVLSEFQISAGSEDRVR